MSTTAPAVQGADRASHPSRRRRGPALQEAIFSAVFDQINEIGYARLTMDRIAAAAGTSKAVLYRRWESRESLVLDALRESLPTVPEPPAGQSLRADLLHVLETVRSAFTVTKGTTFHLVAAEAGGDCRALADERVFVPAHRVILDVLGRAAGWGEIRAELVTDLIAGIGPALLRSQAIDGPVPDPATVTAIVDEILLPLLTAR
ncbi:MULTISPECIES: TetR/AcrR family transcriptional regulator [Protofrankia]|uniref:Regulatory protein TetR n=1 Tax=Candidatus Protofrankia datiscae TaxID=2716812 RepID=F8B1G0_9ACTN|nr:MULTISPECIES: TetR/AcrR family transcriptional regulator [Protofrankia]AEH09834.1 regulatory protein TetR [Candidatus Protofrankia datiscae]